MMLLKCYTMLANLENSAVAIGLEKVSSHSNPKKGKCQRRFQLPDYCTHFTFQQGNAQNPSSQASAVHELRTSRCTAGFRKVRGTRVKFSPSIGSLKKQENSSKNIYFCFNDYTKAFDCVDHNKLWKILKDMGISDHQTCLLKKSV